MTKPVRTDIPVCPHCGERDAWLAQGYWTCHKCHHTWSSFALRKLVAKDGLRKERARREG